MSQPAVAVAIPAYNERDGIVDFIMEIDEALASQPHATFVVVDDCSTDGTPEALEEARGKLRAELVVVRSPRNQGHGPTLLEAYRRALDTGAGFVVAVDGDGQFLGADIRRILVLLQDGGDGACGVRRFRYDPWFRMAMTRLLRLYVSFSFGVPTRDANCPLRGYRAELLDELLSWVPDRSLIPNLHLTVLAARRGVTLVEVDVNHRVRRGAQEGGTMFTGGNGWQTARRLVTFSWHAFAESRRYRHDLNSGRRPLPSAGRS